MLVLIEVFEIKKINKSTVTIFLSYGGTRARSEIGSQHVKAPCAAASVLV